jgi:hypothetical protein
MRIAVLFLLGAVVLAGEPLTDGECSAFARELEKEIAARKVPAVAARFDWDAFLDRVMGEEAKSVPKDWNRGFRKGFKSTVNNRGKTIPMIVDAVRRGGRYTFLRLRGRDGQKTALFRLILPDEGGVNYHEMILVRDRGGSVRVVDVYVYMSAERMSDGVRRTFLVHAAEASKGVLEKLLGDESEYVKHFDTIVRMHRLNVEGRHRQVLRLYESLPVALQRHKNVLFIRLPAAQAVGEKEHLAAIEAFRRHHPRDPCVEMLALDVHLMRGRYDEAIAGLRRMSEAVGGDPYADTLRANVHLMKKDLAGAEEVARLAAKAEPELIEPWWLLVSISLARKGHAETLRLLLHLEREFDLEFKDLTRAEGYEHFVRSPEYRTWLERSATEKRGDGDG